MPKSDTQFKKGQSGNPAGRPKNGTSIADLIRRIGDEPVSEKDKRSKYEVMVRMAWEQATEGDKEARTYITERTEGKALQRMDLNTGGSITIIEELIEGPAPDGREQDGTATQGAASVPAEPGTV